MQTFNLASYPSEPEMRYEEIEYSDKYSAVCMYPRVISVV